ncbi:hypothetical protein F4778DRAFT_779310 [Xylariomycetidae sp. FL2044]|nr:hypothetical protein F4778DRAFT_779310 [Xylariomycetidae sp. FL2044]
MHNSPAGGNHGHPPKPNRQVSAFHLQPDIPTMRYSINLPMVHRDVNQTVGNRSLLPAHHDVNTTNEMHDSPAGGYRNHPSKSNHQVSAFHSQSDITTMNESTNLPMVLHTVNPAAGNRFLLPAQHGVNLTTSHYPGEPRYRGNARATVNSGEGISEDDNCCLHVWNLPPCCGISDLLGAIRGVGRVNACNIRAPEGRHTTSAAKISFLTRAEAESLLTYNRLGRFIVKGYLPRVKWNAHRMGPEHQDVSRVLVITGPGKVVNERYIVSFFTGLFQWTAEAIRVVAIGSGWNQIEVSFSSYRFQARNAVRFLDMAIGGTDIDGKDVHQELKVSWPFVRWTFAKDPCV